MEIISSKLMFYLNKMQASLFINTKYGIDIEHKSIILMISAVVQIERELKAYIIYLRNS